MKLTDIKYDNSYTKQENEEKKEETIMNFKTEKINDKTKGEEYNNTESNNVNSYNNYHESHLKESSKKIKLNQELLKQTKINTEKELIDIDNNKKKNNNKDEDSKEKNDDIISTFGGTKSKIYTIINRCFSDRAILIIIIIMLLYSISLLTFSILDFIKIIKDTEKKYFLNEILFFILDLINISFIIMFHILNYFLKTRILHNFVLVLVFIFIIISIIRCLNYVKKFDNLFAIIISLSGNIFSSIINGLTLIYFFNDLKQKKNKMHGIEEIINFSEMNVNVKTKKEEDKTSKNVKPTKFVEEENI